MHYRHCGFQRQGELVDFGWQYDGLEELGRTIRIAHPVRLAAGGLMSETPLFDKTPLAESIDAIQAEI